MGIYFICWIWSCRRCHRYLHECYIYTNDLCKRLVFQQWQCHQIRQYRLRCRNIQAKSAVYNCWYRKHRYKYFLRCIRQSFVILVKHQNHLKGTEQCSIILQIPSAITTEELLTNIAKYDMTIPTYKECVRDKPYDRTATCWRVRCQSLNDGVI